MIKMNKSKNDEYVTITCPVCGTTSDVARLVELTIDSKLIKLHKDVGFIVQCLTPGCNEYLEKINDDFKLITKTKLIDRQLKITDLVTKEEELARAMLVPSVVEAEIAKAEAGRLLSGVLYHLTSETMHHRAYSVEEILDACKAIGFNPLEVNNRRIGFVLNWLREHKE